LVSKRKKREGIKKKKDILSTRPRYTKWKVLLPQKNSNFVLKAALLTISTITL
jgi:hypothetical protein